MSKKQISLIVQIGSVKWGHERPLLPRKVLSPILRLIKEQKEAVLTGQATLAGQGSEISNHFVKELIRLRDLSSKRK